MGGGSEVCGDGGSAAGEGRRLGEASGGDEEVGDAGVCIAACTVLASLRPVAGESVSPQTSCSPRCESISLGACTSVARYANSQGRVSVHSWPAFLRPVARVTLEPPTASVSSRLPGNLALDVASLFPSVGLTE